MLPEDPLQHEQRLQSLLNEAISKKHTLCLARETAEREAEDLTTRLREVHAYLADSLAEITQTELAINSITDTASQRAINLQRPSSG